MADLLQQDHVNELIEFPDAPCVSVFLSTHRVTPNGEQDAIRLKNLLNEAERQLVTIGLRSPEARAVLEPARELLENGPFWSHQSDGLAVFLAPGWSRIYRLSLAFPELVVAADHFHVKPLLQLLVADGRFYVLALSQNEVRLLVGSRQQVEQVELSDVPQGLAEALKYDDLEKERSWHVAGRGGPGVLAVFHGQGIGKEVDKVLVERFLQSVDDGLHGILGGSRAPLVLAGVGYVQAMFRHVTRYPWVLEEGIEGNPEQLRPEELHERAWGLVQPVFARSRREAADGYLQRSGQGAAVAAAVPDVVRAALEGRVDTLFVPADVQFWGSVNTQTLEVAVPPERRPGDEDLLDRAAVSTLLSSGAVFVVPANEVPGAGPAAAVLRY